MRFSSVVACFLLGASTSVIADPIVLSVDPASQFVSQGDPVDVAIDISGFTNHAAPSLGAYDLAIGFNPLLLANPVVTFGDPVLGDQLALRFPSLKCAGVFPACDPSSTPLELVELSFDSIRVLNLLQAGAFTLATVSFDSIGAGSSSITVSNVLLVDAIGNDLSRSHQIDITNGLVSISAPLQVPAVPEPGGLLLFASVLAGWALLSRSGFKSRG